MSDSASYVCVERAALELVATKLLQRKGMFAAEAEIVVHRMIEADQSGRSRDGVGSLPGFLDAMDQGDIDPRARLITVTDAPAVAVLDGSTGMGHVAASRAMLMAVEKAKAGGIGNVIIRNSRPGGDLGTIAALAASQELIGLVHVSMDLDSDGNPHSNIAWSVPAAPGRKPLVSRSKRSELSDAMAFLYGALCSGLAGVEMPPRKRKAVWVANVVEYSVTAISPERFGAADSLLEKWKTPEMVPVAEPTETPTVPLLLADAERLAGLATKIKLSLSW
ncbi:MAG: Ldh family oxidoreductase [Planctomycetota bacterium]